MKYNSLIIGLSVLALQSCTDNLVYTGTDIEVVLTGNTYQAAFTESSPVSTFNSGNQILLNASGSLQIDNRILTYMDNQWKAENEFSWSDLTGKQMLRQYILSIPIWTMSKKIFIKTIRWKTYCMSRMNFRPEIPSIYSSNIYFLF